MRFCRLKNDFCLLVCFDPPPPVTLNICSGTKRASGLEARQRGGNEFESKFTLSLFLIGLIVTLKVRLLYSPAGPLSNCTMN